MKVRMWDTEKKVMLYQEYHPDCNPNVIYLGFDGRAIQIEDGCGCKTHDRYITMLCSELPDIEDVEIYAGDVVECVKTGFIYDVVFDKGAFRLRYKGEKDNVYLLNGRHEPKKIVGHIYEEGKAEELSIPDQIRTLLDELEQEK